MKRVLVLFLLLLLAVPFVFAEDNVTEGGASTSVGDNVSILNNDLVAKGKEVLSGQKEALAEKIQFPAWLEDSSRFLFKLDSGDELNMSAFILLLSIFFFLFLILNELVMISPSFGKRMPLLVSLVLTGIVSFFGGIRFIAELLSGQDGMGGVGTFRLILIIIILAVAFYFLRKLLVKMRNQSRISSAEETGRKAGVQLAKLKAMSDVDEVASGI